MKIAIIDGINQDIGLKILFPEADYYINNAQFDRSYSYNMFNIIPITDWNMINDINYDILFVLFPFYDIVPCHYYNQHCKDVFDKIMKVIDNNNFKFVAFFDNYDFDYDPNTIINNPKINIFFKRNYNKTKVYKENTIPFPFIMFGEKSLIEKCETELVSKEEYLKKKNSRCFFTGCITSDYVDYNYNDELVKRDRKYFYDRIHGYLYNPGYLHYGNYIDEMRNSKFSLDLLGVGDPNKRTFEILLSGSLMIMQYNHLLWPFENNESFSEETIFKDEEDFINIINKLENDNELYLKCIENQYTIVKKYFNKDWIRNYILLHIPQV